MYSGGMGVQQDSAEAAKWYCLAADQNLAHVLYNNLSAGMFESGTGVTQNFVQAYVW